MSTAVQDYSPAPDSQEPSGAPSGADEAYPRKVAQQQAQQQAARPTPSVHRARQALTAARRLRAEYLVALANGLIEPSDVVRAAVTEKGKPLRRISLRQLHLSQQGWGERRTNRLLSVVAEMIGDGEPVHDKAIAWLIDPRSGGRRYLVWLDAQQGKTCAPWAGFPFTAPEGDR